MPSRLSALPFVTALLLATGCVEPPPEQATYLTLMGNDTLAIEWMTFYPDRVEAQALVRGNRTTFATYTLGMDEAGTLTAYDAKVYGGGSAAGELLREDLFVTDSAGTALVTRRNGEEERNAFDDVAGAVPFVDMLHWPFEAALRWQTLHGGLTDGVPTFTGRQMRFGLSQNDDGSWVLRHPSRGPSTMTLDDQGRILTLDGTGSTRAYQLTRMDGHTLDPAAMGAAFADRPLGALSGRGQLEATVAGVQFTGHYGTPRKRGRTIFGQLLAYDTWWRTGANQATHFSIDKPITIDGTVIPAGDYTLSSIPQEDGGTLIINTMTGQGGQRYDESMDQARVTLRRDILEETVEVFEIRVVPTDGGGRIELRWDDTTYWVPFSV